MDEKIFYNLVFIKHRDILSAKSIHKCNMDIYKVIYHLYSENDITIKYKVKGPKKNYEVTNVYSRNIVQTL